MAEWEVSNSQARGVGSEESSQINQEVAHEPVVSREAEKETELLRRMGS